MNISTRFEAAYETFLRNFPGFQSTRSLETPYVIAITPGWMTATTPTSITPVVGFMRCLKYEHIMPYWPTQFLAIHIP